VLDRVKLFCQIQASASQITNNQDNQLNLALQVWQSILGDPFFATNLNQANLSFSVPIWHDDLNDYKQFNFSQMNYTVVACDGSQVYPDRHMGNNYYLINTGACVLSYNYQNQAGSTAWFESRPYFFTDLNQINFNIANYIDSTRHELEINDGYLICLKRQQSKDQNLLYLADGSLIAWHLAGAGDLLQKHFLPKYLVQLQNFYEQQIPFVAYISLPNSVDLVNLLRAKITNFESDQINQDCFLDLTDSDFLAQILQPYQFTIWFKSQVSAVYGYPDHLRPYFAYFNTGYEIARIELPSWIVQNKTILNFCMQAICEQVYKGYGYPVVLAEAHQQAVIKSDDRVYFYELINQFRQNKYLQKKSRKLLHKQKMNI
jgi:hypothetical protein